MRSSKKAPPPTHLPQLHNLVEAEEGSWDEVMATRGDLSNRAHED